MAPVRARAARRSGPHGAGVLRNNTRCTGCANTCLARAGKFSCGHCVLPRSAKMHGCCLHLSVPIGARCKAASPTPRQ
eukprot:12322213-Alexandrium_andersonii.AAC.1